MGIETTPELLDVIQRVVADALYQTAKLRVARVESYSSTPRPQVTVQPAARVRLTPQNGQRSQFEGAPLLYDVPVMRMEWGPFVVDAELEKGDDGLLIITDHDTDKWIDEGGGEFEPGTPLFHDANSCFFLPMIRPTSKTATTRAGSRKLLISDATGQKVAIKLDESTSTIDIEAASTVNLTAPTINLDSPGVLGGPYKIFGLNAANVGTHLATAPTGGGPVTWLPNPAAGILGANVK